LQTAGGRQEEQQQQQEKCAVLAQCKDCGVDKDRAFGGRVALMEDGIVFPTHARGRLTAAAARPGKVARLPFGAKASSVDSQWKK